MNIRLMIVVVLCPLLVVTPACVSNTDPTTGEQETKVDWNKVQKGLQKAESDLRIVATNYQHREDVFEGATDLADIVHALDVAVQAYLDTGEQNSADLLTQIDLALQAASALAGQLDPDNEDLRLIITGLQLSLGWIQFAIPDEEVEEHIEDGGEEAMPVEGLPPTTQSGVASIAWDPDILSGWAISVVL